VRREPFLIVSCLVDLGYLRYLVPSSISELAHQFAALYPPASIVRNRRHIHHIILYNTVPYTTTPNSKEQNSP
jgi:hypothetical protein